MKNKNARLNRGFTIVELLVVIVVIGVLAAITMVSYNGIQERARTAKINSDLNNLTKAIQAASVSSSKTLAGITGNYWTVGSCVSKEAGTDLALLPKTDSCWTQYLSALDAISVASGINVRGLTDPLGWPYYIDENEGEDGACLPDHLTAFNKQLGGNFDVSVFRTIPLSGFSGCSV